MSSSSFPSCSSSSKRKRDSTISFDDEGRYKRPKYDVFLNYSDEDTGKGFVSHLKGALSREGYSICDRTMIPPGQDVLSELSKAIEKSGIYLVILSQKYASSKQCLDELLSIMDCLTRLPQKNRRVFPIFFNVEPTHVKSQKGPGFMEAFQAHESDIDVDPETCKKWKQAIDDVAQKSGLALLNGDEEKFIRKILKDLRTLRNPQELFHVECPVGVDSRAQDIISALRLNDEVFNIVAVLGISGSGKTTIVKAVYDRIARDFEYTCFIEDVYSFEDRGGRSWKLKLQKDVISCLTRNAKSAIRCTHTNGAAKIMKLIMGQQVLLVLDGVNTFEQLEALGIHHASFNCSSRIIVTTTNKQSLVNLQYTPYDMRLFDETESFELFAGLTFRKDDPVDKKFVKQVVWHAGGLPLVVDVWSRHFKSNDKKLWPSILEALKIIPHEDTQTKLQMSYNSLTNRAKKLFLDIACFFDGMDKDLVVQVSQDADSGFFPEIEIQHLVDKGLVKIDRFGCVVLHQAIKEMGQEVVRKENEDEPGRRSRLINRDVLRVLEDCSGTESVESIVCKQYPDTSVLVKALRKMRNLRLIRLEGPFLIFSQDDKRMSPCLCFKKLRYMEWHKFPFKSLDTIDMPNLVVLRLFNSFQKILWEGLKSLKKLRILEVDRSVSLNRTGNFIGLENLDELTFNSCYQLQELHGSVSQLHKLKRIRLDRCAKLVPIPNLPPCIEVIVAKDCSSLVNLPNSISQLHKLKRICLDGCAKLESIPNLPPSIEVIEAARCSSLVNLPHNIGQLHKLKQIHLDWCAKLESIPNLPPSIEELGVRDCSSLVNLPDNIGQFHKLKQIHLNGCAKLESIPNLPPSIEVIEAEGCSSLVNLPDSIGQLHKLKQICLDRCAKLESIPNLPPSIEELRVRNCTSLVNLSSNMSELRLLRLLYLDGFSTLEPESLKKVYILIKELFFTTRELVVSLPEKKLPDWCSFQNRGDGLSIVTPMNSEKRICSVIICATIERNDYYIHQLPLRLRMLNKTKDTYHRRPCYDFEGTLLVMSCTLDDTTLVVEAGDLVEFQFGYKCVSSCGLRLIYEGDFF